jgi:pyridoxine 5-phosphate synthase
MTEASFTPIRLGVNVDHVATVRQARGAPYPVPLEAALLAAAAGADSITVHLREDRRHIQLIDVERLVRGCPIPINLELAVTPEMIEIACRLKPRYACLVPERREERTTEGGLDVVGHCAAITDACARMKQAGIAVSLFVDPEPRQLDAAVSTGAPHLEIHTGRYADVTMFEASILEHEVIADFARAAAKAGFEVHAGHGLNLHNAGPIATIPEIVELNIGHAIVARAVMVGMTEAVEEMLRVIRRARREAFESIDA